MGNLVGILSTVILVSTLATLVFAVFAYVGSRKRQKTVKVQSHSGNFSIPASQAAPPLPEEFVLKVHDVHRINDPDKHAARPTDSKPAFHPIRAKMKQDAAEPDVSPAEASPEPQPPPDDVETPPPGTPAFRSLADKKKAASDHEG